MRNPLNKRIPREFKKNAGKYIGITIILLATIIIGSSFMVTMDSTMSTLENNDVECKIEDGQFEVLEPVSKEILNEIKDMNINIVENFYYSMDGFDEDATLYVFNERNEMNLPSLFEGELPREKDEIAIERLFAKNRKIQPGDEVEVNGDIFTVTGTIAVPDYNSLFKNNQDLLMNTTDFGVAVVSKDGFATFSEGNIKYRYSYRFGDADLEEEDEKKLVEEIQKCLMKNGASIQSYLTDKDNQSITFLREDMGKDGPAMKVFIYLLIAVIAFVFAILTSNTIEAEAAIIGTLRASGYKKSEIVAHYISPTIIIALAGSIIGNAIGYTLMIKPFEDLYYKTYSIAPLKIEFNLEAFVTTTIVPVVLMILINWFMLYNKLSLSPLKFLRKDLNKKKQKKAVKLPDVSFITRFRLRVLLQNKVGYMILFVGVFISSFLLMFGIGLEPLFDHYVDEIDDSLKYEYQYILKAPVSVAGGEKIHSYSMKTWYELGKKDISVSFMGISENSEFFSDIEVSKEDNEIVISEPLAKKMKLEIGDEIEFKDEYTDKKYSLKVAKVVDYKGSLTAFMDIEKFNELLEYDKGYFNSCLSDEKLDIEKEDIIRIITRSDMVSVAGQMMESFGIVMQVINIASVGIYMILMYILTKIVIEKNALAISFMKVFGYGSKEVGKVYLNATTIVVMASLFICIPLEALCFKVLMDYIASMIEGYIEFYLPVWVYIAIIVIGIVAYFAINMLHIKKVKSISLSEALKNRE